MDRFGEQQIERILARQVATELTLEEIEKVSGGEIAGTSYDTCSGGAADACDVD